MRIQGASDESDDLVEQNGKMEDSIIHSIIPSAQMEEFVSGGMMCIHIYICIYCIYIYTYRSFGISFLGGATPEEHAHRSRSWVEPG